METGDWIVCEHKVQVIKKMDNNRVQEVSDGSFSTGSWDLSDVCFPLTLKTKKISCFVEEWKLECHDKCSSLNLNWPDISRHFTDLWVRACKTQTEEEEISAYKAISDFAKKLIAIAEKKKEETIDGIKLFR